MIVSNPNVRFRSQTVFITQDVELGKQLEFAKSDHPWLNILTEKNSFITYSFDRYLRQFDPIYLFVNGLDLTNQNLMGIGPLLLVQFPFLVFGIIFLVKNVNLAKERKFILGWILLGMFPSGLTFEAHSPHRVVMVFTMINIICASGVYYFFKLILPFRKYFYLSLGCFILVLIINLAYFLHMYFINFPFEKSQFIQYPFKQVAEFAWSQYPNYDSIVFDPQFGSIAPQIGVGGYYYFAYYGNVTPAKFQKEYKIGSKPREILFDKFSIRQVYWPEDRNLKNTLVIVSPWSVPKQDSAGFQVIKRFNFYDGSLAFYAIKL